MFITLNLNDNHMILMHDCFGCVPGHLKLQISHLGYENELTTKNKLFLP